MKSLWLPFDINPLGRSGSVTICLVCLMHAIQAGLMLASKSAVNATATTALLIVFRRADAPDGAVFMALVLLASAVLALAGTLLRLGWVRLAVLLPQHLTLGIMAFGGIIAAARGAYLDGTAIPWQHIAADQIGFVTLFAIHTYAVLRRAQDG